MSPDEHEHEDEEGGGPNCCCLACSLISLTTGQMNDVGTVLCRCDGP